MKKINYFTALCLIAVISLTVSSCQKSYKDPKKPSSASLSYWYGSYYFSNNTGKVLIPIGILFRNNGTIKVYDFVGKQSPTDTTKTTNATGTYKVGVDSVTITYKYDWGEIVNGTGTFSPASTPATMSINFDSKLINDLQGQINLTNQSGNSTLSF